MFLLPFLLQSLSHTFSNSSGLLFFISTKMVIMIGTSNTRRLCRCFKSLPLYHSIQSSLDIFFSIKGHRFFCHQNLDYFTRNTSFRYTNPGFNILCFRKSCILFHTQFSTHNFCLWNSCHYLVHSLNHTFLTFFIKPNLQIQI